MIFFVCELKQINNLKIHVTLHWASIAFSPSCQRFVHFHDTHISIIHELDFMDIGHIDKD